MRYENDRLEQYSRRETIRVVGVKEEEGWIASRRYWVFSKLLVQTDISVVHRTGDRNRKGRPILVRFVSLKDVAVHVCLMPA